MTGVKFFLVQDGFVHKTRVQSQRVENVPFTRLRCCGVSRGNKLQVHSTAGTMCFFFARGVLTRQNVRDEVKECAAVGTFAIQCTWTGLVANTTARLTRKRHFILLLHP